MKKFKVCFIRDCCLKICSIYVYQVNDGIEIYGDELHCLEKIQNAVEVNSNFERKACYGSMEVNGRIM